MSSPQTQDKILGTAKTNHGLGQLTQVREHLVKHGSLTSWDAIQTYRLTRLSQYILLLRQYGYQIDSVWEHNDTRRWVKYILISIPVKYEGNQMVLA